MNEFLAPDLWQVFFLLSPGIFPTGHSLHLRIHTFLNKKKKDNNNFYSQNIQILQLFEALKNAFLGIYKIIPRKM